MLYQAAGPQLAIVNQNNQVELRKVGLGRDFGNTIEITSGISESESIIANPPDYLVDGMKVSVQAAAAAERRVKGKSMLKCGFGQVRYRHAGSLATLSALAVIVSGCMVGPNYHKPSAPVPPAFNGSRRRPAPRPTDPNAISYSDWWKVFHDPKLDDLETQAAAANRDIKIAIAHVDEASAVTNIAHSYLLPTVAAAPNVSRNREAQNRPNNGNTNGHAATYTDIQLPLVASYEIDAWGRIRRSIQSARATQEATEADLRFVRLSIEATVAIDYYNLRETDQELKILDDTLTDLHPGPCLDHQSLSPRPEW